MEDKTTRENTLTDTATQKAAELMPRINQLLQEHGVNATVSQLHLTGVVADGATQPSPQVRCYWNDEGVFVCE